MIYGRTSKVKIIVDHCGINYKAKTIVTICDFNTNPPPHPPPGGKKKKTLVNIFIMDLDLEFLIEFFIQKRLVL